MQARTRTSKQQVVEHLRSQVDDGVCFIKSRDITQSIDLTAKEIGAILSDLSEQSNTPVAVDAWSYTNSTTWRISPK